MDDTYLNDDEVSRQVHLAQEFANVMAPLVPPGKMALQFIGEPQRIIDKQVSNALIELAKVHKCHRKLKHAQCGISVIYEPGENEYDGEFITLRINSINPENAFRRVSILVFAIILTIIFILKLKR